MKKTEEFKQKIIQDTKYNDILEKLTTNKEGFKQKLSVNDQSLFWTFAGVWGVCFKDVSNLDLSSFSASELSKVPFSTYTKFPDINKLPKGFNPQKILDDGLNALTKDIQNLHKKGIDGRGITIAVIDKYNDFEHDEIDKSNFTVKNRFKNNWVSDSHGLCVVSMVCGKHNGIVPKSNVIFYPTTTAYEGKTDEEYVKALYDDTFLCFKEILKDIENGKKIDVISFSGCFDHYRTKEEIEKNTPNKKEIEFEKIKKRLEDLGCEVITAKEFWDNFGYCYKKDNLKDKDDLDNYSSLRSSNKINVICGGKTLPLCGTKSDYYFDGTLGCASWSIPQVASIFALTKQIDSTINFKNFVKLAKQTSKTNKDGVKFLDVEKMYNELQQTKTKKDCILNNK